MNSQMKRVFGGSAALFGLLGLSALTIGELYPVLLENLIGTEAVALFAAASSIYFLFLMVCTVGLPQTLARAIATRAKYNDGIGVKLTFRYALITFGAVGAVLALLLFQGSESIAKLTGLSHAAPVLRALAPALFFLMITAAFRGYFQGLSSYAPSVYSHLLEQAFKLGVGLVLATLWSKDGHAKAATGAAIGVMIGEVISLALLVLLYILGFEQTRLDHDEVNHMTAPTPLNRVMLIVWKDGLITSLAQAVAPIFAVIDAFFIVNRLVAAGFDPAIAQVAYGVFAGAIMALVMLPPTLWKGINEGNIATLREYWALKQMDKLRRFISSMYSVTFFLFVPIACVLSVLAEPILSLLFPHSFQGYVLTTAASLLRMASFCIPALALGVTSEIVMLGMRKGHSLLLTTTIATLVKVILMAIVLGRSQTNVLGAAFASLVGFWFWAAANTIVVLLSADLSFDWMGWVLKTATACVALSVLAHLLYAQVFMRFLGSIPAILLTIAICAAAYIGICVALRTKGASASKKSIVSDHVHPNFDA